MSMCQVQVQHAEYREIERGVLVRTKPEESGKIIADEEGVKGLLEAVKRDLRDTADGNIIISIQPQVGNIINATYCSYTEVMDYAE